MSTSNLTPQRWLAIERIVREGLEQPREERDAYLDLACIGNKQLRADVQSFLDSHDSSDGFLETPAINVAARSLAKEKDSLVGGSIGPYRILKAIGAGGMGEVYLAEDTRLQRQIAIKMLPAEFATDPGRVHRFELEARAAGALNHPNILVIHDTGVHFGLPYIASEYLQGETLRARLSRGPIPLAKTLDFAIQMAQGLAAAHESGVVHRDLKPDNIFITSEGRIKILDFGLAKLTEADLSPSLTHAGVILGTVGYLSPEQVRGQQAVRGSDLFSFGCVLYEMLTGKRAFLKDTPAETLAAIVREEPPQVPSLAALDPFLIRTLMHCLEKSPAERFHSAHDLAFTLETIRAKAPQAATVKRSYLPWLAAGALALTALTLGILLGRNRPAAQPLLRFEIPIPGDPVTGGPALAISPDGQHLAFMAMGTNGRPMLWVRALDEVSAHVVPASEDAKYPFWSPDSRLVAFHAGAKLKAFEVSTGGEQNLATIRGIVTGAWNADNVVIVGNGSGPLMKIQNGGEAFTPVTTLDAAGGERSHGWPAFLPDNQHFVFTVNASTLRKSGIYAGSLGNAKPVPLLTGLISNATYVSPGYLVYAREANVFARPFDAAKLKFTGAEFQLASGVRIYYSYRAFSTSETGTLVFRAGESNRYQLNWFDRSGTRLGSLEERTGPIEENTPRKWSESALPLTPALSPDGTRLATVQFQPSNAAYGIWISSLAGSQLEYPVTDTRNAEFPVWSPDGSRIAYSAAPSGGARDLFAKRIDESGHGTLLYHSNTDKWPLDWSADGKTLLFLKNDTQARTGLWYLSSDNSGAASAVPNTPNEVKQARFSPDGHWVAYTAEQFGVSIVYVQDFPKGAMRVPVSEKDASEPIWSRDGRELFYLNSRNELMAVPMQPGGAGGIAAGTPKMLFKTNAAGVSPFTVTPDGKRFLIQSPAEDKTPPAISVVANRF